MVWIVMQQEGDERGVFCVCSSEEAADGAEREFEAMRKAGKHGGYCWTDGPFPVRGWTSKS